MTPPAANEQDRAQKIEADGALVSPLQVDLRRHNFLVLTIYHVVLRVGWIFKTESIVMPAILDSIGGGGWLRGFLPTLNRLGQSLPPLIFSDRIRCTKLKSRILMTMVLMMGGSFLILALTWFFLDGDRPVWLPFLFLVVYAFFWLCVGVHNLSLSLLYGKLIEVTSRGQLMLVSTMFGSVIAIASAWYLMRPWLSGDSGFVGLFLFSGIAFVLAGLLVFGLVEQPDFTDRDSIPLRDSLIASLRLLKQNSNFRMLAWIAVCYGIGITLTPHYQAYVKRDLGISLSDFVPWVIAQNIGAAVFSLPLGKVADRYGNRLALQLTMLLLCLAPILSMVLVVGLPEEFARNGFLFIFFLLGLMPVSMRTFNNYTLEITERDTQPIFLSTLGICMAVPVVLFSTLVGAMIDWIGFEQTFLIVVAVMLLGWTLTFKLVEPRHHDRVIDA